MVLVIMVVVELVDLEHQQDILLLLQQIIQLMLVVAEFKRQLDLILFLILSHHMAVVAEEIKPILE